MVSRGFAAEEARAAFDRAQQLAVASDDLEERFAISYGLWLGSLARGELKAARQVAESFLGDALRTARTTEMAVGHRILSNTCLCQGDLTEAQVHSQEALRLHDPERDRKARLRFGQETGAGATAFLAHISWLFGDFSRARKLIEEAAARAIETSHIPTQANVGYLKALFEALYDKPEISEDSAEAIVELARRHGLPIYLSLGTLLLLWSRLRQGAVESGLSELKEALKAYSRQGNTWYLPFFTGLLAQIELELHGAEDALTCIDRALDLATETDERWSDSLLNRIRGEVLIRRDPANTAPAEQAFLTAVEIARHQKARSFELRAALSLAKLYQSTGRAADARAVLAPALEGFAPTPEFREIEEAQTLLATLA
jgi:predicted ATPase